MNFFGTEFRLDGVLIGLDVDQTIIINSRNVTLSGVFADGTPFDFDLNTGQQLGDFFDSTATITVTLTAIPEPTTSGLLVLSVMALAGRRRRQN